MPPELRDAIQKAQEFAELAWQLGPDTTNWDTARLRIFGAYLTIAFEHHSSTMLLFKTGGNDATAYAIHRLLFEAFYRGLWVLRVSTNDCIDAICRGEEPEFPQFRLMTEAVDERLGNFGTLVMAGKTWNVLNGLTHSGIHQVFRRFDSEGNMTPNYSLDEILEFIKGASLLLATMTHVLCVSTGRSDIGKQIMSAWKRHFVDTKTLDP